MIRRAVGALLAIACAGDDGSGAAAEGCGACAADGQLCQVYANGDVADWVEACAPMPPECYLSAPCDASGCVAAMYASCDAGYHGRSTSCYAAVLVTCAPDTTPPP